MGTSPQLLDVPVRDYGAVPSVGEDLGAGLRLGGGGGAFRLPLLLRFPGRPSAAGSDQGP